MKNRYFAPYHISKHILASNSYSLNLHIWVAPLAPPFFVSCWFNPIRFVKPQTWVRSPTWNDWLTGWWLGGGGVRHFVLWVGQLWQPKASGGIVFSYSSLLPVISRYCWRVITVRCVQPVIPLLMCWWQNLGISKGETNVVTVMDRVRAPMGPWFSLIIVFHQEKYVIGCYPAMQLCTWYY